MPRSTGSILARYGQANVWLALALAALVACSTQPAAKGQDAATAADVVADGFVDAGNADIPLDLDVIPSSDLGTAVDVTAVVDALLDVTAVDAVDQGQDSSETDDSAADAQADGGVDAAGETEEVVALPDPPTCPLSPNYTPGPPPTTPETDCPDDPPQVWKDAGLVPVATLPIDLGQYVSETFAAYEDGGWAAITHGPQGLTHVVMDVRMNIPDLTGDKVKISGMRAGRFDCTLVASAEPSTQQLMPIGNGNWGNPLQQARIIFPVAGADSAKLCSKWLDVRVLIRLTDGRWGKRRIWLRLYDQLPP